MTCKCGNAARYINTRGELCCGICPIKEGIDSIKLASVPELLRLARGLIHLDEADARGAILQSNIKLRIQRIRETIGVLP